MAGLAKAHRSPLSRGGFLHNSGAQEHTFWNHLWLSPNSDGAGRGSQHWAASGCGGLLSRTPRPAVAVGLSRDEGRWGMSGGAKEPRRVDRDRTALPRPGPTHRPRPPHALTSAAARPRLPGLLYWDSRLCESGTQEVGWEAVQLSRRATEPPLCREVPPCSPPGPTRQPGAQSLWSPHLAASLCPSVPSHTLSHASQLLLHITVPTSLTIPVTRTLGHCLVSPEEQLRIGPSAGLRVSTLWPCLLEQPPMPGTLLVRGSEPCDKGQAHGL